jgi:hypothetical protein
MTTPSALDTEVSDEEIVAHTVRLARSGRFRAGRPLMDELYETYAEQPQERVKSCARQAAELMLRQHDESASAMRLPRRR